MKKIKIRKIPIKYKKIIIALIILLTATLAVSSARFIYNKILDFYFMTKGFYFESDKLKSTSVSYELDNWNGVDDYDVTVNLLNYKNSLLKSESDIDYEIEFHCSHTVTCSASKTSGTIYSNTDGDSIIIHMSPTSTFTNGDVVVVGVTARSTHPYTKTLHAQYRFIVGTYGLGYEIKDEVGKDYLQLDITNTLDYYTVAETFGTYSVGDQISTNDYMNLSETDRRKCYSAIVNIDFDPNIIKIDNTSSAFKYAYGIGETAIGGYNYINEFKYNIEALSSNYFRFYKKNKSMDYSESDILNVSFEY